MSDDVTYQFAGREALVYFDGCTAHALDDPEWSVDSLDYVQRATLAAKLRAIASVIEPGTFDEYLDRVRHRAQRAGQVCPLCKEDA